MTPETKPEAKPPARCDKRACNLPGGHTGTHSTLSKPPAVWLCKCGAENLESSLRAFCWKCRHGRPEEPPAVVAECPAPHVSLVPCGFCYEGRDTVPVLLHTGKEKWLCPKCIASLIENAVDPRDSAAARKAIAGDSSRWECGTCHADQAMRGASCIAAGHDVRPVSVKS